MLVLLVTGAEDDDGTGSGVVVPVVIVVGVAWVGGCDKKKQSRDWWKL